jgi:hypothetical protein
MSQDKLTANPSELDWAIYTGTGYAYLIGDEKAPLRAEIRNNALEEARNLISRLEVPKEHLETIQLILDTLAELKS